MSQYDIVYSKVCDMICDAKDMEMDQLSAEMPLYQIGLDSLDYVELMVLAKREFKADITAESFVENPNMTLGELCQLLANGKA